MLLRDDPPLHLTYCLNIHPGETWEENFAAIRDHALRVKARVAPDSPFGLGLRLSARAAETLNRRDDLDAFKRFLDEHDMYVFTINGFPYGTFHGTPVKSDVYRPDWRTRERLGYTKALANILVELLPEGVEGSISTVPGSYDAWIETKEDIALIARNLTECAEYLAALHERTGRHVVLALEPEPDCLFSTTAGFGGFVLEELYDEANADVLCSHIGACADACHQAVAFKELGGSLDFLREVNLRVAKMQLSAALRCSPTPEALARLAEFRDPVYLHQVRIRRANYDYVDYPDLDDALAAEHPEDPEREEWRIHYHVPLFFEGLGELHSTASLLDQDMDELLSGRITSHLEIETYTFSVLPPALREADVVDNVAREYEWVLDRLPPAAG